MRSQVFKIGGLVAAASAVVIGGRRYFITREDSSNISTKVHVQPPEPSGTSWDHNWDRRAPQSSVRPPKPGCSLEEYENKLNEAQPTAVRNILLVRHGQYQIGSNDKRLTSLGREQVELTAQYLRSLNIPINRIAWSTKPRATETGQIISQYFKDVPTEGCQLLEEGEPPVAPNLHDPHWVPPKYIHARRFAEGARMEAAFRKYFHRASPTQTEDSYEILSCHHNVAAYCVLRALQLPPPAWSKLSSHNASVTWIQIAPNGHVNLLLFGDTGFIPPDKITFS